MVRGVFVNPEGGSSLIHDRATSREIQQRIPATEDIRAFRMSTSILGLGYVEAVDDQTLLSLAQAQAAQTGGRVLLVEIAQYRVQIRFVIFEQDRHVEEGLGCDGEELRRVRRAVGLKRRAFDAGT